MVFLGFHIGSDIPVSIGTPVHITRATSMVPTIRNQKLLVRFPNKPDICICKIDPVHQQGCDLDIIFDSDDIEEAPPILISELGEWDVIGRKINPDKNSNDQIFHVKRR